MLALLGSRASSKPGSKELPQPVLKRDALERPEEALLSVAGVPATADAIAYEPINRLLAVATSDGKVKLLGHGGTVEVTLYSAAKYPYATRQLLFLKNRGVLVRVSKGGFLESWSLASSRAAATGACGLGTVKVRGDKVCCVADLPHDPFVLLGCASGSLRVALLADSGGQPVTQPRAVRKLKVSPYRVRPAELCGQGEVRHLAVQSFGPVHRALVLFTGGMVSIWDLRAAQLISCINPADEEGDVAPALAAAGPATATCWIGTCSGDLATGHVDGSVLVWTLRGLDPGPADVISTIRVVPGAAEPVRMLRCAYGEVDGLLVLGGQEAEQPEVLTLVPLAGSGKGGDTGEVSDEEAEEDEDDEDEEGQGVQRRIRGLGASKGGSKEQPAPFRLPWFGNLIGFCLLPEGGSVTGYEDPAAVLQLVEGGQLVLYHLGERQPLMVGPAFQQRTGISVADTAMVPVRRPPGSTATTMSLTALRKVAAETGEQDPSGGLRAFDCGLPPEPPPDATWGAVYCTGYKDGSVALWDVFSGTPRLLCSGPEGEDAQEAVGGSGAAVTCLCVAWPLGLVITGHHKGEVRVYQFSSSERQADCVTLSSVNVPGTPQPLSQPAGLQLRLRVRGVNSGDITSLAFCQTIRAIAVGDKGGGVALVDTARPVVRWYALPLQGAVLGLALAPAPLPPARVRTPEVAGEEGQPHHMVFVSDSKGSVAALDAAQGCFVGRGGELQPKNTSYTLALELLDGEGLPLWCKQQLGAGCSVAALTGAGAAAAGAGLGRAASGKAPGTGRGRSGDGSGGGRSGKRRSQGGSSAGGDEEDEELGDDEDVDIDTLLARAAAQVNGTGGRQRSAKLTKSPSRKGQGSSRAADAHDDDTDTSAPAALSSCPDPPAHMVLLVTDQYLRIYTASSVIAADRSTHAKRHGACQLVYARVVVAAGGVAGVVALAAAEHGLAVHVYALPTLELVHEAPLSASTGWYWDVPPGHERRLGRLAATSRLGHLTLLGLSQELLTLGLVAGLPRPPPPTRLFDAALAEQSLAAAAQYEAAYLGPGGRLDRAAARASAGGAAAAPGGGGALELLGSGPGVGLESDPVGPGPGPEVQSSDGSMPALDASHTMVRTEGRRVDKGLTARVAVATEVAEVGVKEVAGAAKEAVAGAAKGLAGKGGLVLGSVLSRVQAGLKTAVEETTRGVKVLATNVERGLGGMGAGMVDGADPDRLAVLQATHQSTPRSVDWYASQPDLGAVFSRTVPEDDATLARLRRRRGGAGAGAGAAMGEDEDDDDVSLLSITDDEDEEPSHHGDASARAGGAAVPSSAAGGSTAPGHRRPAVAGPAAPAGARLTVAYDDDAANRADLFGGAAPPRPAARLQPYTSGGGGGGPSSGAGAFAEPRTRTADEIKRAYGREPRAATARTNEVRHVMDENMSKLHERGERLRNLDQKAADLESSAMGFADMARQLAERERNKKWWQL